MTKHEILKKIESKGFNKTLWNKAGKMMHSFNMIEEGDKIAVGISGGKDSLTLFNLLLRVKLISNIDFEIIPISINYKFEENENTEILKKYFKELGYELLVEGSNINRIVFKEKKEKNPCSLCSRLRRGILYRVMKEKEINKLALGHHLDDIIETFLMNLFYQGSVNAMKPSYTSKEYGFRIIRPLGFVEEKTIIKYTKKLNLPVIKSDCEFNESKFSKRVKMKNLITELEEENKEIRQVILNGLKTDLF